MTEQSTRRQSLSVRHKALRTVLALLLLVAFVAIALFVPHPSVDQMRQWASSWGPAFPAAFFAVHVVATIVPIPRTIFTITAGLLFGAVTGIALTVLAATVSAVLAFALVRYIGRDLVAARMTHPALAAVDARLKRRGWLAVGSLRLIAPVPFSVVNYSAGVSAVGLIPFALATLVGIVPGTVGIVLLGDALGGHTDPLLLAISGSCIGLGVVGLIVDARTPVAPSSSNA